MSANQKFWGGVLGALLFGASMGRVWSTPKQTFAPVSAGSFAEFSISPYAPCDTRERTASGIEISTMNADGGVVKKPLCWSMFATIVRPSLVAGIPAKVDKIRLPDDLAVYRLLSLDAEQAVDVMKRDGGMPP